MVIDPETKQPTRVGITVKEEARDGKVKTVRVRVAKKSGKGWHDRYYCRSASHPALEGQITTSRSFLSSRRSSNTPTRCRLPVSRRSSSPWVVGAAARDSKLIEGAVKDLTLITGQKPKITKAKKSVAQFHLREGQAIGAYVTLRGDRVWEFLDRLLTLALPRIRDFRGINGHQFDGQGNYNFGLTEAVHVPRDRS